MELTHHSKSCFGVQSPHLHVHMALVIFFSRSSFIQKGGVFKLFNHSLQFVTTTSEFKLKPRADSLASPDTLC